MPETKTIEIDEIISPDEVSPNKKIRSGSANTERGGSSQSKDPFADLKKSLGWKTRTTLWATQKFIHLRSKAWGTWVIVLFTILALLLAIPIGLTLMIFLLIRIALRPLISPKRP